MMGQTAWRTSMAILATIHIPDGNPEQAAE
jgi:hypothetical protein